MTKLLIVLAAAGLLTALARPCAADDDQLARGKALVVRDCSRCHAVGKTDASRHKQAPPFRTLSKRYPIESLEEALAEGIITGHPDMPEFQYEPDDVGAIIVYLKSIQQR